MPSSSGVPVVSNCYRFLTSLSGATTWLVALALLLGSRSAHGQLPGRGGLPTAAAVEAHNETAAPSLSRQVRDARRITAFLADALCLTTAQQLALQQHTLAVRAALLLATSDGDVQAARLSYLAAVRRVLVASQLEAYVALRQKLAGTTLPLDGLELAAS